MHDPFSGMHVRRCSQMSISKGKTIAPYKYKHFWDVRILKSGERKQRSEFLIFFSLVVSKDRSYFFV